MGLDMYLYKEIYVGGNFEHREVKGDVNISIGKRKLDIPVNKISTIRLRMGYWRKANHIHRWFVENVQNGVDECQDSYVSRDDLLKLKSDCEAVLGDKSLAEDLLPTQSGCFFGSTEYDEYYFRDIEDTIKIVDECLKDNREEHYYNSSW